MWPQRYGGAGWSVVQQHIFDEECAAAGAPAQLPFALRMVAPVLMRFATEAQQAYFLPKILSGEHWWCQGYSEPGAGSDLASLRTSAVRDGDHYVVNGQKTWNTLGQYADWIFCLVRTSTEGRPQQGISFLLIDMKTPGGERAPDRHARRRARDQRDLLRERARAGRQPRGRGEPRLDLREVPARARAHQQRRHRQLQARADAPEADRGHAARRRAARSSRTRASAITSRRWSWS